MLTQEQIQAAIAEAMPDVLSGLRKQVAEQALRQAKDAAAIEVQNAVVEWVKAELLPEVQLTLAQNKAALVSIAPSIASGIAESLSVALMETIKKKLESSWERKKIFDALIA